MKRLKYVIGAAALVLGASAAHAQVLGPDWYLGLSGDVTWLPHANTGYGGNVALGYRFMPSSFGNARLEGELGYHRANGDSGFRDLHYYTYMGNLYYDFNFNPLMSSTHITPYVGAGIGDTTAHFGNGAHGNAFAYQFMAGLTFTPSATPGTDWSLGYRYQGSSDVNGGGHSQRLNANSIELGLRFHF